ncbi:MAG: hypothetical protein R3E97_02015 [Candidatus Eisenbacteria bacterium]
MYRLIVTVALPALFLALAMAPRVATAESGGGDPVVLRVYSDYV